MQTWDETRLYIERTLEDLKDWHKDHNVKLEAFNQRVANAETEIKLLKQKAALIGFITGAAASGVIGWIMQHLKS